MKLRLILIFNLIGILLILSWALNPFGIWQSLDESTFWFFNQFVDAKHPNWTHFLARVNMRVFDTVSAFIMAGVFLWAVFTSERKDRWFYWFSVGIILLITAGCIALLVRRGIPYRAPSPTVSMEGARRLSDLITDFRFKDYSGSSFPGDHGMVLFTFCACMFRFAKKSTAWISVILSILLVAPRILVGAHWFSDIFVGSLSLVLIIAPWFLLTPVSSRLRPWISNVAESLTMAVIPKRTAKK